MQEVVLTCLQQEKASHSLRHHGHRTFNRSHQPADYVFCEKFGAVGHEAAHGYRRKGTVWIITVSANSFRASAEAQLFTTQSSSSALQGDLPGEGVSSGLFCLQLLLGARKHVPPQQQHFGEMIAHKGGTWEHV